MLYFPGVPSSGIYHTTGIVRRSSMHNVPKPAPPIRRTPSMPAGAPTYRRYLSQGSNSSGELQQEPEYADPQEVMAAAMSKSCPPTANAVPVAAPVYMTPHMVPVVGGVECIMPGSGVETLPVAAVAPPVPPPMETAAGDRKKVAVAVAAAAGPHADEMMTDLPPPPPPEELEADIIYARTLVTSNGETGTTTVTVATADDHSSILRNKDSASTSSGERKKMGSVADTHANIIANLNAKFASGTGPTPSSPPVVLGKPPLSPGIPQAANSQQQKMSHSQSSESDTTPTADNPPSSGMLSQIQRGMTLRRTLTNDRSAPKFN